MLWLQYVHVLIVMTCGYRTVTGTGLRITSKNTKVPKSQLLKLNNSAPWIHKNSVKSLTDHPTKRQTQSHNMDYGDDDSNLETYDNQATDDFDDKDTEEAPSYRQVILDPNAGNALRRPLPYPFHPLHHVPWNPYVGPLEIIPNPIRVHHYRKVPVAIRVQKYENVPEPYYVPYKPTPDYTVTHVDVFNPGNPCRNGGIAVSSQFGYHCLCSRDYHGRFCDAKLYCTSSPCENGGTCEEIENNYQCKCKPGYLGYNCEEKNACKPSPCKNDGECVETENNYKCYCRPGFIGKHCEDLDYCDPNPCQHGGSCQQRHRFHECICREEFKGKVCEKRRVCFSNPCKNGGECVEDDSRFPCVCPRGYSPPYCNVHVCDSNPCLNNGRCVPRRAGFSWTYQCICSFLYKGENCEIPNPCVTTPCLHGGTCIDTFSKYTGFPRDWDIGYLHYYCMCPAEYSGQKCEENLCDKCDVNAACRYGRCVCNDGFRGDGFKCTANKNPCIPNPCRNNGTCSKGPDESFDCTCPKGYFPPLCTTVDVCTPNPCKNSGICVKDAVDKHHCICPDNFLPPDCANKTAHPCVPNPCQNGATCQVSKDKRSFTCNCKGSFKPPLCTCDCTKGDPHWVPPILSQQCKENGACYCPSYNGKTYTLTQRGCEEARTNPCNSNPCQNDGKCFPSPDKSSFFCQCLEQCTGDLCQNCDATKICKPGYCKNGGTCIVVGTKPFCKCPPSYLPPDCSHHTTDPSKRNLCHPNPCQNGGTCRIVGTNARECSCPEQYGGKYCERDKCIDCDVHAMCNNGHCKCRKGFRGSGLKGDCKPESECNTCPLNAVCVDGECSCISGFYFIDNTCKIIGSN